MTTSSQPVPLSRRIARFLPSGRAWWIVAAAFVVGLLLFLLVLKGKRDEFEFYRADGEAGSVEGQVFEPLPVPLPAGEQAASGMDDQPPPRGEEAPRIDQHAASPAAAPAASAPPSANPGTTAAQGDASTPRLVKSGAPQYPRSALRTGASGEVLLRIHVGTDGTPTDVEVIRSSGHRDLDRAAQQAIRRWRFEPAMRNGTPVPATVQQLVSFSPPQ